MKYACAMIALILICSPIVCGEATTAPSGLVDIVQSSLDQLDHRQTDPKHVQVIFSAALKAIDSARDEAQLGKSPPTDPARRAIACRLDLLEAELNRRASAALPEKDPTRSADANRAAALFRATRVRYAEIPAAAAGYAGEARVLRASDAVARADRVLDPVILDLTDRRLAQLSPEQLRVQRLLWLERLKNRQRLHPADATSLAKQIAASKLMRGATDAEKKLFQVDPARAAGDATDPLVELAYSIPTTGPANSPAVASTGMDDYLRDIRNRGLDVCFVIDATESMDPWIEQSKKRFNDIVAIVTQMLSNAPGAKNHSAAEIRFGLVAFKDYGDDYGIGATRALPLTADTKKLQSALDEVIAGGGGDISEPTDQALRVATSSNMGWNRRRRNVIVLVSDAPIHASGRESAYALAQAFANNDGGEINIIDVGGFVKGKRVRDTVLPDFQRIADNSHGSAFLLSNDQAFWRHLIVSIFGQRYEQDVQAIVEAYSPEKK